MLSGVLVVLALGVLHRAHRAYVQWMWTQPTFAPVTILDDAYEVRAIAWSERSAAALLIARVFAADGSEAYTCMTGMRDEVKHLRFLAWFFLVNLSAHTSNANMVGCFDRATGKLVGFYMYHDLQNAGTSALGWLMGGIAWAAMELGARGFARMVNMGAWHDDHFKQMTRAEESTRPRWVFERMVIDDACQGRGLGSAMLHARLIPAADALGALVVLSTQKEANVQYYAKAGFTRSHRAHFGPSEGGFDSVFMIRQPARAAVVKE